MHKNTPKPVTVASIHCPLCDHTVYSRAGHDMRSCLCGTVSIDGGFGYTKVSWKGEKVSMPKIKRISIDATQKDLYDDWNHGRENYGLIQPGFPITEVPPEEADDD